MGRLLVFLATSALLLGGNAVLNWWVDPFGEFWKPAAVEQAGASRPQCLVSHEVIGGQYLPFKLDVFRTRPTRTFVIGSSRVLKIGAWPGERAFANLGMPVITPEIVLRELEALPATAPPQTVYLGVELFWFNPHFAGFDVTPTFETKARYALSRSAAEASVRIVRRAPYVLLHRWRREQVGPACVIGRSRPALAWKLDGSRVWSFELQPGTYHPLAEPFTTDLQTLRAGIYADWQTFSARRVQILAKALALARARGWRVVGFAPPDGSRYVRFFRTSPLIGPRWRRFGSLMPSLFHRYGFKWLDFRDARAIPCGDGDFVDGGFHTNGACSMKIRARLDAEAHVQRRKSQRGRSILVALGDSIPAAVPRECECRTGYVALYGRALAHVTKKPVAVDNRAVPGSNSSDLRAAVADDESLRAALARADAIIVTIGHNDTPWIRGNTPSNAAALLRRNLEAILSEIRVLRRGRPTLLRVTNFHNDSERNPDAPRGRDIATKRTVDLFSRVICSVAARYRAPCADVYHAFNGRSGRLFDGRFVARDHIHPNQQGHRVIADLLIRLGFAPLAG